MMVVGLIAAGLAYWPSVPQHADAMLGEQTHDEARLLTSDQLADEVVKHTIAFHKEAGPSWLDDQSPEERAMLEVELRKEAKKQALKLSERVSRKSEDAARQLLDLQLSGQQWENAKTVMQAMHDKRIQDMGSYIVKAAHEGHPGLAGVAEKLEKRHEEMRQLADEFIPANVRDVPPMSDGHRHWEVAVGPHGELSASGKLGNWDASLAMSPLGNQAVSEDRSTAVQPRQLLTAKQLAVTLWVSIASVVSAILSIVVTVLSAALGPVGSKIFWYISLGVDTALCGTTLGIGFHPNLRSVATWVPCMIMSTFTGVETIWTFRGRGGGAATPAAATPAAATPPPAAPAPAPAATL